jgi:hypothetical protein
MNGMMILGRIFHLAPRPKTVRARPFRRPADWHARQGTEEPECPADSWRQRDRWAVVPIAEMDDNHLSHALRFASEKPQHASRLGALLREKMKRADK